MMDVDTDSEEESGSSQHFGQRRPPLSVAIKRILERYPDGQIFKVSLLISFRNNIEELTQLRFAVHV